MNNNDRINREEKDCYMKRMSDYISDTIAINYKYFKNSSKNSFKDFFKQSFDAFSYSEEELNTFYEMVEDSLQQNHSLIRINAGYDKPLVLKDLNEEE